MMNMTKEKNESQRICLSSSGEVTRLLEIMKRLRDPEDGCPWDIEQTYEIYCAIYYRRSLRSLRCN